MPPGLICLRDVEVGSSGTQDAYSVDIVAVHGIAEDSDGAWTNQGTGVNWLRDLQREIPNARVLTYGYDATTQFFFGKEVALEFSMNADSFIAELHTQRRRGRMMERPIIFVCHGLGGLLVKKALIQSSNRRTARNEHLLDPFVSTYAILFFGTPHGSTSVRNWHSFERCVRSGRGITGSGDDVYPQDLYEDIKLTEAVHRDFSPLIPNYITFCLWEQVKTSFGYKSTYLVDSSSATFQDATQIYAIHNTHSDMVKFASPSSQGYQVVRDALLGYCEDAPANISAKWSVTKATQNTNRSAQAAYELGISTNFPSQVTAEQQAMRGHFYPPLTASTGFVGRRDALATIYTSFFPYGRPNTKPGCKSFVVYGMGGSGKTELCAQFALMYRKHYAAVFSISAENFGAIDTSFAQIGKIGGLEATKNAGFHFLSQIKDPWLLVIDNADDPDISLPSLFPYGDHAHILVTTRNPYFRDHGTLGFLELQGLPENDALDLLFNKARIPSPRDSATLKAGSAITEALGYLAIALIQAGTSISKRICRIADYLKYHNIERNTIQSRAAVAVDSHHDLVLQRVYASFELSRKYLRNQNDVAKQDALELLNISAFYHFQRVPVPLFLRAIQNISKNFDGPEPRVPKLWGNILRRVSSPTALPLFLQRPGINEYEVRQAVVQLQTASLISYDEADDSFSLHPLVHSWARDSLSISERELWSVKAFNILMESIQLSDKPTEDDGFYHASILPHLSSFGETKGRKAELVKEAVELVKEETKFFRTQVARFLPPYYLWLVGDRVLHAAKCGFVLAERGLFEKAALHLQVVTNTLLRTLGIHHTRTMQAAMGLASIYWGLGDLKKAIGLQESVVTAREHMYGPSHELTLQAMDSLGYSYWLHGYHFEALRLHQQATKRMKETLGEDHDLTLTAHDHLGASLGSLYRHEERLKVHQYVLKYRERKLGTTHLDTLVTLDHIAVALLDLGRAAEAKPLITMVHNERKRQLGREHPWTLWSLCNLAKVLIAMDNPQAAMELLQWGVEAAERSLKKHHLGILMGRGELARAYARLGKVDEAESLTIEIIALMEAESDDSRGPVHPDCVFALFKFGQLYELKGNIQKAIETYEEALRRVDSRMTAAHPLAQEIRTALSKLSEESLPANQMTPIESPERTTSVALEKGPGIWRLRSKTKTF